ncbi:hypothetical protein R1sor_021436 [Riccia sorocarpa]|uniref:Uncharacterized protein n=1 Tax=Riccia sorocarpa TaxID=122646 RepID=A0ABD3GH21_9MARC
MEVSTERKKSLVFAYYVTGHGFGHARPIREACHVAVQYPHQEAKPISYGAVQKYFEQDPSRKWAAYVAGTILVNEEPSSVTV